VIVAGGPTGRRATVSPRELAEDSAYFPGERLGAGIHLVEQNRALYCWNIANSSNNLATPIRSTNAS
jgi:hypothetical protein